MQVTLMHNPNAGEGEHPREEIVAALKEAGHDVRYQSTRKRKFARALDEPADVVLVAGGDGTVRKVATRLAGRGVPLAILPCGTANNISKAVGVVRGLRELAEGLGDAVTTRIDLGEARGPFGTRLFVEALGAGCFARLVRSGNRIEDASPHLPGNPIDQALELMRREVKSAAVEPWRVRGDGQELSGDYLMIEVMNTRLLGPNVPLAPGADPCDGELDLVLVGEAERATLLQYLEARLRGDGAQLELGARRVRQVELAMDGALLHIDDAPWPDDDAEDNEVDGERRVSGSDDSDAHVTIRAIPGALDLLVVPRSAQHP